MDRGILMSKKGRKAVILTKEGEFQTVRLKKNAQILQGQRVHNAHLATAMPGTKKIPVMIAACLAIFLAFGLISDTFHKNTVAAYVSFDVNPSLEAAVNEQLHILSVEALNDSAKHLLQSNVEYKDMTLDQFVSYIATTLSQNGYLMSEPEVVVTTVVTDKVNKKERQSFTKQLSTAIVKFESNTSFRKSSGTLEIVQGTLEQRREAKEVGLTTGKYLLFKKASKELKGLTAERVAGMSVKELHASLNNGNKYKKEKPKSNNGHHNKDHKHQATQPDKQNKPGKNNHGKNHMNNGKKNKDKNKDNKNKQNKNKEQKDKSKKKQQKDKKPKNKKPKNKKPKDNKKIGLGVHIQKILQLQLQY